MEYKSLIIEVKKDIGKIILNRPKALNAFNLETLTEFRAVIVDFLVDIETKVLIVTGRGKAFCAGADLGCLKSLDSEDEARKFSLFGQETFNFLAIMERPVIAAVNGYALGGGCELALACDLIYATDKAEFGQPEINFGFIPGWGATQRLPQRVGSPRAKELIFSGKTITAQEALEIGLVNGIFPDSSFEKQVMQIAQEIAKKDFRALKKAKESICGNSPADWQEEDLFGQCFAGGIPKKKIQAFLKRKKK